MHNTFFPGKRGPWRPHPSSPFPPATALVDERCLSWLAAQRTGQDPVRIQRQALVPVLSDLVRQSGLDAGLLRTYLFAEQAPTEPVDGVLVRTVARHGADGGWGMVRALGQELTQLAARGQGLVLVLSDDERLIPYIDEAQWRGTRVVLVGDEALLDMATLARDDPSWARLLSQADRRLALSDQAWVALTLPEADRPPRTEAAPAYPDHPHRASVPEQAGEVITEAWRDQVDRVIRAWWSEETPLARSDLQQAMRDSQGVPPDTDRHLLLRVRRELARPLSFQEKKAMREMVRATVLDAQSASVAPSVL